MAVAHVLSKLLGLLSYFIAKSTSAAQKDPRLLSLIVCILSIHQKI